MNVDYLLSRLQYDNVYGKPLTRKQYNELKSQENLEAAKRMLTIGDQFSAYAYLRQFAETEKTIAIRKMIHYLSQGGEEAWDFYFNALMKKNRTS
jgi:hypothetical protein